ncbi:S8 family serine peptidase [Pseudofrankia sp. BMG5.36]|uniref:S8 family serine peptidase n=1 Tax=Pseudofrankia sp. BMG5.36 TaxID=1834512 RepID=UPI0008D99720|nr:S8 family serine peptidase [Pseudofrankia sp. BMG5.36]OHV48004.1 peptidase S8 [Pseudofrankia sp. BMG5.36]
MSPAPVRLPGRPPAHVPLSASPGPSLGGRSRRGVLPGLLATALAGGMLLLAPGLGGAALASQRGAGPWYVTTLRLDEAHEISTGAGVVVAIIDGGVDPTVPALVGQLLPGAGIGDDAAPDGLRDDDPDGHGTSMAGIVAARSVGPDGQPTGFAGVAPGAKILSISTGRETDSDEVAESIRLATDRGAKVISLSLGSSGPADPGERAAVRYALARDVVVVAAAGNVDSDDHDPADHAINSPANIPGVIAVTGSNPRGDFWDGSASGPLAVLAAPAPSIRAPVPVALSPTGAQTADGTSNSTAIVAGVVALVRAEHPELGAPSVIDLLVRTADDNGPSGRDEWFGYGVVDPVAALRTVPVPVATNPLLVTPTPLEPDSLNTDEDALLSAGTAGEGRTGAAEPTPPAPGAPASVPPGVAAAGEETGPGALAWVGGLAAAVLAGIAAGLAAFVARTALRRRGAPVPPGGPAWP